MTKLCSKCQVAKPFNAFYKSKKGLHRLQAYCKECNNSAMKTWSADNREAVNAKARKCSKQPKSRYMTAIRSAKRRGYTFDISMESYLELIKQPCYYCDNKLGTPSGSGLDRVDNSKPYTIDNVVPCCRMCNLIKHEHLTQVETKHLIQELIKLRGL